MEIHHERTFQGDIYCGSAKIVSTRDFHWHEHNEIVVVSGGEVDFYIEGETHRITRGDMLLIAPYALHCAVPVDGIIGHLLVFSFTDAFSERHAPDLPRFGQGRADRKKAVLMRRADYSDENEPDFIVDASKYFNNLKKSNDLSNTRTKGSDLAVGGFILSLIALFALYGRDITLGASENSGKSGMERIKTVCEYIEKHTEENISLERMASLSHYSVSHFGRMFKSVIGCTFKEYVDFVKIKEAQRCMNTLGMSVTEVSYLLGFSHPNNFGRTYKRVTGKNPSDYTAVKK